MKPVFVAEAKATDPVLGGGSLTVRPEGLASASSAAADTHSSLPQNTQRARATGQTYACVYTLPCSVIYTCTYIVYNVCECIASYLNDYRLKEIIHESDILFHFYDYVHHVSVPQ